jgi:hypothetical protein
MLVLGAAICLTQTTFAQGQISFSTIGSSGVLRFSNTVAGTWAYAGVVAGLYWGEDAGSVTNLVEPLARLIGPAETANPAYWGAVGATSGGGTRYVGRIGLDTYFQVRVWSEGYNSWEDAFGSGSAEVLISSLAQAPIVVAWTQQTSGQATPQIPWGGTIDNPIVVGVFSVPEPATCALLVVGGIALSWRFHRRFPRGP